MVNHGRVRPGVAASAGVSPEFVVGPGVAEAAIISHILLLVEKLKYRVTILLVQNLPLTSQQKFRFGQDRPC